MKLAATYFFIHQKSIINEKDGNYCSSHVSDQHFLWTGN